MPSKIEEFYELAQRTANGLTRYWEHWADYLTTASRLYKYNFQDQLLIYAQRPNATACASFDIWNRRMNRYIRRGSKGIALLDQSGGMPRLNYVFDVSDTGVRLNSRAPEMWELNNDLFKPVSEMLTAEYGISHERLSQQIVNIAEYLVNDYWDNNSGDILGILDGSFFDDYDDVGKELQFKSAAIISISYTLLERCGFEPNGYFDKDDFQAIYTFSTPDAVYALGAAVSDISREVLRKIERTVKTTTRRRNVERMEEHEQQPELHEGRRLSSAESDLAPAAEATGQVRQDAPELPERAAPGAVQLDAAERNVVSASAGSGADGRVPDAADDGRTPEAESGPGQSAEPTDVGAAHEQPAGTDRGNDSDGADLRLNFQSAAIPTEAEQIQNIDQAESEKKPSAFSMPTEYRPIEPPTLAPYAENLPVSDAVIDEILRTGSNRRNSQQRLVYCFMTDQTPPEYAEYVKHEYGEGGKGYIINGAKYSVWFNESGMMVAPGDTVHDRITHKAFFPWEIVSERIHQLLRQGEYLPQNILDDARPNALREQAEALLYMERDMESGIAEKVFADTTIFSGGFPDATDRITGLLTQPDFVEDLNLRLSSFAADYAQDKSVMRFHFYRPDKMAVAFQKFAKAIQPYQAQENFHWQEPKFFITQAEVDTFLKSGDEENRLFKYSAFLLHRDKNERAEIMKRAYGEGGMSPALSGAFYSHADYSPSKGLVLSRGNFGNPTAQIKLKWNQVADRVAYLIDNDLFLTAAEREKMPAFERKQMAQKVVSFYASLPKTVERPFSENLYYWDRVKEMTPVWESPEQTAALLQKMENALGFAAQDAAVYQEKAKILDTLRQYVEGRYTVFPEQKAASWGTDEVAAVTETAQISMFDAAVQEQDAPVEDPDLSHAKQLIADFYEEEYYSLPAFPDLSKIGIAFTTVTDEEIPIQVNVDLVNYRLERYLDDVLVDERQYDSLHDLIETELENLDFDELTEVSEDEVETWRQDKSRQRVDDMLAQAEAIAKAGEVPQYERFSVRKIVDGEQPLFAIWDDLHDDYYEDSHEVPQFPDEVQAASYLENLKKEIEDREAAEWLKVEHAKFLAENDPEPEKPTTAPKKERNYRVGDTLILDGKNFTVDKVGALNVQLRDPDSSYPIFRSESKENLERLLQQPDTAHLHNQVIDLTPSESKDVTVESSDEELDELPISTVINGEAQTFPNAAALDEAVNTDPASKPAGNFRITDYHLGEGGAKEKYRRNIEAIKTVFRLEQEHRGASAEEQAVLSQYVGWGGLSDAFDPGKASWAKEYAELKGLLSEEEYAAARSSVLNAHYTSPVVIRSIYDAVEKMGFKSGNILEPSMGVGNFFGMLPESMVDSRLYGVELDSITGRIAQKLYPQADITVAGFETTDRRDFYDIAVGNVPFGQYRVNDKAYNKLGFSIHNYFFAKSLDQVRPGGIVVFVTSRYTLDSKDSTARKHIAECADLLGAIRLPNNAFKANAGTEVVSDIIFLQKRDRPIDREPAWVQLGKTEDGFAINQYFIDYPEMVLGELTTESTQYGHDLTVAPIEGAELSDQLAEAVQHIEGQYTEVEVDTPDIADEETAGKVLPADPDVKNFSYTVVDGEVYYRENSIMTQVELSDTAKARVTGMVELRQIVNELIQQQLDDFPDAAVQETQAHLNDAYDAFSKKYGLLNDRRNARLFEQDSSYYLFCSLENLDENKQLKSKADMFTKRTIRPERIITSVDTPSEALAVSMGEHGRVDLPYMAELLGTPGEYDRIITELQGVIFKDPAADPSDPEAGWQMADEYLSGDVRAKLRFAHLSAETNPEFSVNVAALEKAQPKELEASEIDVRLGATWLAPAIIQKFMQETFQIPYYLRHTVNVRFSPYTAEWRVEGKSALGHGDIMSTETYGTQRANAYKILEDTLNLKDVRIYDTIEDAEGKPKRVLNKNETTLAQQKQQAIKDAFANWIWQDPQRRISLVKQYNELFNSTRPREYDGSHIHFVGMNPEITLREHQRNAIAHVLYGGNTLLAHEVGAGKSATRSQLKRLRAGQLI